jgi:hypothetical protein
MVSALEIHNDGGFLASQKPLRFPPATGFLVVSLPLCKRCNRRPERRLKTFKTRSVYDM